MKEYTRWKSVDHLLGKGSMNGVFALVLALPHGCGVCCSWYACMACGWPACCCAAVLLKAAVECWIRLLFVGNEAFCGDAAAC